MLALAGMTTLGAAGAMALLLLWGVLYLVTPGTATIERLKVQRPSVILDAAGQELYRFEQGRREWVGLSQVSPHVIAALIATEDHRFYDHGGVDYRRLAASTLHTLRGDRQGGSTLSMQLARNLFPERVGGSGALLRKCKELVVARKIERVYTKDEILEAYLNQVPFLYNVRGIEMAAQTYFGKPARSLDVAESATLVGMLKATSAYNPVRHPERSQQRRNVVLSQMVRHGTLSADEYERLKTQPIRVRFERPAVAQRRAPHFTAHVRRWLEPWARKHGLDLRTAGLRVHTTLDLRLQQLAEQAAVRQGAALQAVADVEWSRAANPLRSQSPHDYAAHRRNAPPFAHFWQTRKDVVDGLIRSTPRYRQGLAQGQEAAAVLAALRADAAFMDSLRAAATRLEVGFVALDPRTGHVRAWVGSRDYFVDQYDHVAKARRQPGSTFKPFVYAAALERGMTPEHIVEDRPVEVALDGGEVWRPANAGGFTNEPVTLRRALAESRNSVAVQLIEEVGPRRTARLARRLGIRESRLEAVPSLALGTSAVTLLEMTSAYATLAAGGVYREPVVVTRVEDAEGTVLFAHEAREDRVLRERTAQAVVDMMRGVVDDGTGQRVRSVFGVRADVAGKTGTTQHGADGWFLLMHPHLVGGAWVGFNDPRVTFRSDYWGQGAHNALYVAGDFYRHALRQGRLDPRPSLGPAPVFEHRPGFFDRAGQWFAELFEEEDDSDRRVAEARPAPPAPPPPPRRQARRRASHEDDAAREIQRFARDLGRVAAEVGRFLEHQDARTA
ncbi:MAG: PBP1A family penicillin-binding protein, partial [Rhodothermales bacterium]|nr:PBP1A family penicillin-binding protein [Rhodothermales bacterium]